MRVASDVNPIEFRNTLAPPLEGKAGPTTLSAIGTAEASGKSAAFFLLSADQRYVIKSMTKVDYDSLLGILPEYTAHVEANPTSFLPRFLGLFDLTLLSGDGAGQSYSLVVMTNFFAGMLAIHKRFDLKGSTYKRAASEREKAKGDKAILKDLDWMEEDRSINFPSDDDRTTFVDTLRKDTAFLHQWLLIDYSLLVGIHKRGNSDGKPEKMEYMHVCTVDDGAEVLYIGIVDILQPYTWAKRIETVCCGSMCCSRDISCQPPERYADRFAEFLESQCCYLPRAAEDATVTDVAMSVGRR